MAVTNTSLSSDFSRSSGYLALTKNVRTRLGLKVLISNVGVVMNVQPGFQGLFPGLEMPDNTVRVKKDEFTSENDCRRCPVAFSRKCSHLDAVNCKR